MKKILIIRFSSFGDIVQCMSVTDSIRRTFPACQIHWVARADMGSILTLSPNIDRVWHFDRQEGMMGLFRLGITLRQEGFDAIYDAHSNIRSRLLSLFFIGIPLVRRSKERLKRLFLFGRLHLNFFPKPYRGMYSYQAPLTKLGISFPANFPLPQCWNFSQTKYELPYGPKKFIALIPSAAWPMKRWPIPHWQKIIELLPAENFVILGGPADLFCQELALIAPHRVTNLAGKTSLAQSAWIVSQSRVLISADTGFLHVADLLGHAAIALIGPTAFGHTSSNKVKILEVSLDCRPCTKDGRGRCSQKIYQRCMVEILPSTVASLVGSMD